MQAINILLIEDNEGDILLTTEAFEESNLSHNLTVARNGKEALNMLIASNNREYILPDLILLDINLPLKNGFEVLESVKKNSLTKHIPVVMFSTSSAQKDVNQAYALQASSFICKPSESGKLKNAIDTITEYWVNTVRLPQ
jgi:CheY-like chemotaxis protein